MPNETNSGKMKGKHVEDAISNNWGHLPMLPCKFCHKVGKVFFMIDDGREGIKGLSPVRCDDCGHSWTADTPNE